MALTTITILARKGGVGRTTTTLNLAGAWAKQGLRCLCLDLDSQASLSRCLLGSEATESRHPSETITAVFDPQCDPEPDTLTCPTAFDNLHLIPAGDRLEHFNVTEPWDRGKQQHVISALLSELSHRFDIVLIDTGPNTCGLSAWASLIASQFVLSPVLCDSFGTQSIISVQRLLAQVQDRTHSATQILGYFVNMRQRNAVMDAYESALRKVHGSIVLDTVIPHAAAYRQAMAERRPVVSKGNNKAVKTIIALADEVGERIINIQQRQKAA